MIRLMVVAGDRVDNLVDFFSKQGTFEVECAYNNLTDNIDDIHSKIIRVDKMLYIYPVSEDNTPVIDIKSDMQLLRNLLQSDGFFRPGEIIFLANNSEVANSAVKYFQTVLQDCNYQNYSIKLLDSVLTFPTIYNAIMGVSATQNFDNSYKILYRVERNAESTLAYKQSNDKSLSIEPFSNENLLNYEAQKELYNKLDSGNLLVDAADEETKSIKSPDFNRITYNDRALRKKILLVSGNAKSGKSTWSTILSISAFSDNNRVLVLDFTANGKVSMNLSKCNKPISFTSLKDFLLAKIDFTAEFVVCKPANVSEESVCSEFLQNILFTSKYTFDVVIVVIDNTDFVEISRQIGDIVDVGIYTTIPMTTDVMRAIDAVQTAELRKNFIILDECVKTIAENAFMNAEEVKTLVADTALVIKHCDFGKYDVGPSIFRSLTR